MVGTPADIVFQSYGRCCKSEQFFVDFYDYFMASSPAIKDRFRVTDMSQQRHLLRNGIMQLVLYARGMSDRKLRALGDSHNRSGYNIPREWYSLWLDALMKTVGKHDPEFSRALEDCWREVLTPGIDLIRDAW